MSSTRRATTTRRRRFGLTVAVVMGMTLLLSSAASGDNLTSDAATSAGITTITAGDSTTITYRLVANAAPNGDVSGCDATSAKPVTVTINAPAAVSAPASLTFTGCGQANSKTAAFSSGAAGSYPITHSISGGVSGSQFNDQADFTLTVNAPAPTNTQPTLDLPTGVTAEATGPNGAAVAYKATAADAEDGTLTPFCAPASGATFPLGVTQVDCSVTDNGGLTNTGMFDVTVVDTTPPSLDLPSDVTVEATGPNGAAVSYAATAGDIVDGSVSVDCSPGSGSTFGLGQTTVSCSATDAHGNTATGSFAVDVVDTTAPSLDLPSDMTVEATGATGAAVSYTATGSDIVDGSVSVDCSPASGSTFPLDETTTVSCSATDAHGNTATGSFTVEVVDTTAPSLSLPADITTAATGNSQAAVAYTATATDLVDGSAPVSCNPPSGSSFSVGATTVSCSATDAHGNTATGSFHVTVNYGWNGFFRPIDNNPDQSGNPALVTVWNSAKAGQSIPVKFSLGGNQGLAIPASGYPKSVKIACSTTGDTVDPIETYSSSTAGLQYDPTAGQYIYTWKTATSLASTCQMFELQLRDGTTHYAFFKFTK